MTDQNKSGDEATSATDETAGLKAKVSELLGTIKELQGKITSKESAAEEAATEAERAKGDIAALEKRLTDKHEKAMAAKQAELDTLNNQLRTEKLDNGIKGLLTEYDVMPEHMKMAEGYLMGRAKFENGEATIDGIPLADFGKSFFGGKEGQHLVRAREDGGSGALGSTSVSTKRTAENFSNEEWASLSVTDPTAAKAWAVAAGKQNLADSII